MGSAAQAGGFIAAAGAHPNAKGDAVHVRHLGGSNAHAAGELCDLKHDLSIITALFPQVKHLRP